MKKGLSIIILVAMLAMVCFGVVACAKHECQHVCPKCNLCTDKACTDPVCADKCKCEQSSHTCKHVCPTCGLCQDASCTDPACANKCPGHSVVIPEYKIEEEFDNPEQDYANWDKGEVKNMHTVENGMLTLTNTGATDYPSKGRAMQVSIDKYPYLAINVAALTGGKWSIKLQFAQDETSNRVLQADTNTTGVFFYDLRTVEGMPQTGNVSFDLYIYIMETDSSVSIDYIRSTGIIPDVENFNSQGNITVSDGTAQFQNGIMTVKSTSEQGAKVTIPFAFPAQLVNMLDIFVPHVADNSTWSLSCGNTVLVEETSNYGAIGVDAAKAGLDGKVELTLTVKGQASFDQIAGASYNGFTEEFEYATDDDLLKVWKEEGTAYIELDDGMLLYKVDSSKQASVSTQVTTNVCVYPELSIAVEDITNAKLDLYFGNTKLVTITENGTHKFNVLSQYQTSGIATNALRIVIEPTVEMATDTVVSAKITSVSLAQNAEYSKNALAPKGHRVDQVGKLDEQGYNSDNWIGDATVVAQNGKLQFVQSSGYGYSKGEVFAVNVDLSVMRYLNVKVDELSSGAKWKLNLIYNPSMTGEIIKGDVIPENSNTGIYTIDLYQLFNLNEDNKVAEKMSYSIFIVGGVGSVCTVDYITNNDQIDATPEIVNVVPAENKTLTPNEQLTLGAELKLHKDDVTITVTKDEVDVTEQVLNNKVFQTEVPGTYVVTFSYAGAQSVTRTITVTSPSEPVISVATQSQTLKVNQQLALQYELQNAVGGGTVTVTVKCNDVDVTADVLTGDTFATANTGVYTVEFTFSGAATQTVTLTVVSNWTSTDKNIQISEQDGTLVLFAEYDWPKAEITFRDMVIDNAPFLKITVDDSSNAAWKVEFGDAAYNVIHTIKGESGDKGTFYIDLRQAPYEGKTDSPETITFYIYVVGTNAMLKVTEFKFVQIDEVPDEIVDIKPETDKTVAVGQQLDVSAKLKLRGTAANVSVTKDGVNVTESVINNGVFAAAEAGTYTITFSHEKAQSVTRTVIVEDATKPVISVITQSQTIKVNQELELQYELQNVSSDDGVTIIVKCNDVDVTADVLTGIKFAAANTGVYTVEFAFAGAATQTITLTVESNWTSTDNNIQISEQDGALILHADNQWPKAEITFRDMVIDDAPFLKITVGDASNAAWKLEFGDKEGDKVVIKGESGDKGTFYIDLRQAPYENKTDSPQTITFYIYVVGTDVQLVVEEFEFVTEKPAE